MKLPKTKRGFFSLFNKYAPTKDDAKGIYLRKEHLSVYLRYQDQNNEWHEINILEPNSSLYNDSILYFEAWQKSCVDKAKRKEEYEKNKKELEEKFHNDFTSFLMSCEDPPGSEIKLKGFVSESEYGHQKFYMIENQMTGVLYDIVYQNYPYYDIKRIEDQFIQYVKEKK